MTKDEVLDAITQCLENEIGELTVPIERETTAGQVPGWDSLAHVGIVIAIEERFEFEFEEEELLKIDNVGALVDIVHARQ